MESEKLSIDFRVRNEAFGIDFSKKQKLLYDNKYIFARQLFRWYNHFE
jgi:hypothetical protein